MRGHVLRGLDLAQQLLCVAADAVVVDLEDLDAAARVDNEGPAGGKSFLLDQ